MWEILSDVVKKFIFSSQIHEPFCYWLDLKVNIFLLQRES